MAKRREQPENLEQTKRISPYQQIDEGYDDGDQELIDEAYDDAYADEYEYDDAEDEDSRAGGFFSGKLGKILIAVIALLFIVILGLAAVRFLGNGQDAQQLPSAENTPEPVMQTPTPGPTAVVFAPVIDVKESPDPTAAPTPTPTAAPTAAPTGVPEPTDTPLPIILTNTPTPRPSGASVCSGPSARSSASTPWATSLWTACWRPSASTAIKFVPIAGTAKNKFSL